MLANAGRAYASPRCPHAGRRPDVFQGLTACERAVSRRLEGAPGQGMWTRRLAWKVSGLRLGRQAAAPPLPELTHGGQGLLPEACF